jgi:hypothetical protein
VLSPVEAFPQRVPIWWDETTLGITPSSTEYSGSSGPKSNSIQPSSRVGKNDGQKQNFVTPGLVMGRFRFWRRVGFTVGGGYQIAATHFHTTNHNAILSIRFPF